MMTPRAFRGESLPPLPASTPTVDWQQILGSVDLEIGAGAGLFAVKYGQEYPARTLIAIERTEKFLRLRDRIARHHLKNVIPIRADAIWWTAKCVPPERLERIFILYPNPYPKRKHRNLRWPNMPFMGFLLTRLKHGGELVLATNKGFYQQEAVHQFTTVWGLELHRAEELASTFKPRTHFEKKYLAHGETCWNLVFVKA